MWTLLLVVWKILRSCNALSATPPEVMLDKHASMTRPGS
jgi:hypothetical protein